MWEGTLVREVGAGVSFVGTHSLYNYARLGPAERCDTVTTSVTF